MRNRHLCSLLALSMLALSCPAVEASVRCAGGLVNEGESSIEVARTCGEPNEKQRFDAQSNANGTLRENAATIEVWVYGPSNGMYRYFRFVDGVLTSIQSKRE
ncbi:MAG TPA: DUF2845 domain-containing protein [Chitinolyticbacter sp.]|nr:DUF2845 domain-containing protein [Chitinolyticbacter sp.]